MLFSSFCHVSFKKKKNADADWVACDAWYRVGENQKRRPVPYNIYMYNFFTLFIILFPLQSLLTGWQIIQRLESCWSVLACKRTGAMESLRLLTGTLPAVKEKNGQKSDSRIFCPLINVFWHSHHPINRGLQGWWVRLSITGSGAVDPICRLLRLEWQAYSSAVTGVLERGTPASVSLETIIDTKYHPDQSSYSLDSLDVSRAQSYFPSMSKCLL